MVVSPHQMATCMILGRIDWLVPEHHYNVHALLMSCGVEASMVVSPHQMATCMIFGRIDSGQHSNVHAYQ